MCAGSRDHGDDWWGPKHGPSCWCLPAEDPPPAEDAEGGAASADGVAMDDDGGELDAFGNLDFCPPATEATAASSSADADGEDEPTEEELRSLEAAVKGNEDAIASNEALIKALRDALG